MKRLSGICAAAVTAAFMSTSANAVNVASDGIGEVAIAPYYTVRDGWQTLVNLTNTTDSPVVVKVRFHESRNSRDVLDFLVALSSFDVFTGVVRQNADGVAEFRATDQADDQGRLTCTVPSIVATQPQRLNPLGFSGGTGSASNDDGGPGGDNTNFVSPNQGAINRLSEGYVEFVVMGYADADWSEAGDVTVFDSTTSAVPAGVGTTLDGAINVGRAIEQHDCSRLDLAFSDSQNNASGNQYILDTARQMGEPINSLKFNFRLLNAQRGTEAGNAATTWANFYNAAPAGTADATIVPFSQAQSGGCNITRGDYRDGAGFWQPGAAGGSCDNLVAAQNQFQFLEPSLNDAWPAVGYFFNDTTNSLSTVSATAPTTNGGGAVSRVRGIDAVSATIQRSAVVNEWSSNAQQGVTTDWIVTLPTKAFYVDQGQGQQYAVTLNDTSVPANTGSGRPEACVIDDSGSGNNSVDFDDDSSFFEVTEDCLPVPYPPFANAFGQTSSGVRSTAQSCNEVGFVFYDRAEQSVVAVDPGVIVSPAPPPVFETNNLCKEANVITFNGGTALDPQSPINVDTSALGAPNGWMFLTLNQDSAADLGLAPSAAGTGATGMTDSSLTGLPAIGFNLKQRNFGDITRNFSSSIDHGYLRSGMTN